jgi:hypothetical protein
VSSLSFFSLLNDLLDGINTTSNFSNQEENDPEAEEDFRQCAFYNLCQPQQ